MSELFAGFEFVGAYIDDILTITKGNWTDHLNKLEKVFERIQSAGLKINAKKSFFGRSELEYLGYCIRQREYQIR